MDGPLHDCVIPRVIAALLNLECMERTGLSFHECATEFTMHKNVWLQLPWLLALMLDMTVDD